MIQTSKKSFLESFIQSIIGSVFGYIFTLILFSLFNIDHTFINVFHISLTFFVIILSKTYLLRRLFDYLMTTKFFGGSESSQTTYQSWLESILQTIISFVITYYCSVIIYPFFGVEASNSKIGYISIIFTVISSIKNYIIRRYFEKKDK